MAAVLDTLGSGQDLAWPSRFWPPLRLNGPLAVGARGGHGAVRYRVEEYLPGRGRVVFRFEPAGSLAGFEGRHLFEVLPDRSDVLLRHEVDARCDLRTFLLWRLLTEPVHDAAIEDAFDRIELEVTGALRRPATWTPFVRWLRRRRGLADSKSPS